MHTAYFSDSGGGGSPHRDLQHQTNAERQCRKIKSKSRQSPKILINSARILRIVYSTVRWYFSHHYELIKIKQMPTAAREDQKQEPKKS